MQMSKQIKGFLVFDEPELSPERQARYTANIKGLRGKEVVAGAQFDWNVLDSYGLTEKVTPFLKRSKKNCLGYMVEDNGWWNLFHIEEDSYLELMKEFIASFSYHTEAQPNEEIRFRMCGKWYEMSLINFGVAMGLYPEGSNEDREFREHMMASDKTSSENREYNDQQFWNVVSGHPYDPSNSIAHMLRDPIARLLHRFLTMSIYHAEGAVKLPRNQWFTLYCLMNPNRILNIPHLIAMEFSKRALWWMGRNPKNALISGPLITHIARNLNAIMNPKSSTRTFLHYMTCVKTKTQGMTLLLRLPVLIKENDSYRILNMGEGQKEFPRQGSASAMVEEEAPQEPPRRLVRRRPRSRDDSAPEEEQDQRTEDAVSMSTIQQNLSELRELMIQQNEQAIARHNYAVSQMDQLGRYSDDLADQIALMDRRAQYRHQYDFTELPQPDFMGEFPSTRRWIDRRGNQDVGSSGHSGWRPW